MQIIIELLVVVVWVTHRRGRLSADMLSICIWQGSDSPGGRQNPLVATSNSHDTQPVRGFQVPRGWPRLLPQQDCITRLGKTGDASMCAVLTPTRRC
jgi:hypothetical protein